MMLAVLWAVWLVINLFVFALYGADKQRAKRGAWRISERTLLIGTWLLGGVGAWAGMQVFRHKTKHLAFRLSAPAAAVLSIAAMIALSTCLLNM